MDLSLVEEKVKKLTDKQLIDGIANYSLGYRTIDTAMLPPHVLEPIIDVARREVERRQEIGKR